MKNYLTAIMALALLSTVALIIGCRQSCPTPTVSPTQQTWTDADGRVWVGGCAR